MTDTSIQVEAPATEIQPVKPKAKTKRKRNKQAQPENRQHVASEKTRPANKDENLSVTLSQLWENRKFLIEVTAVIVVFLTAFFALGQQRVMQGMLDELQADRRPWVGLGNIIPIEKSSAVLFQVVNSGRSPALNARIKIMHRIENGQLIQLPVAACGDDCTFRGMEMLPNAPLSVRLPKIEEAPVPDGVPIWYIARIDYDDAAGKHHKTGICLVKKDLDTRACPISNGNYAD